MKIKLIKNIVQTTAETIKESAILLRLAAPHTYKKRSVVAVKPRKRQYTRDCEHGCGKRVKGAIGQGIHNASAHKTEKSL